MTPFYISMSIIITIIIALIIRWIYLYRQNKIQFKPFKSYEKDLEMFILLRTRLLNNQIQFCYGLCNFIKYFNHEGEIYPKDYFRVFTPKYRELIRYYYDITATDVMRAQKARDYYWWPSGEIQPRIDWLEECIILITTQIK